MKRASMIRSAWALIGAGALLAFGVVAQQTGMPSRPRVVALGVGVQPSATNGTVRVATSIGVGVAPSSTAGTILASGTYTSTSNRTGAGIWSLLASAANPYIGIQNTGGAANGKLWFIGAGTSNLSIATLDDTEASSKSAINFSRTANAVTQIDIGNGTDLPAVTINGIVATPASGTFTATGGGFTANPTGTATYYKIGNAVTLNIPNLSNTSNTTGFTISGLPAAIQPATIDTAIAATNAFDSGAQKNADVFITHASGVLSLRTCTGASCNTGGWTASGTKGVGPLTITYLVN